MTLFFLSQVSWKEQAATEYSEQDDKLTIRDPPKAPPLKSSVSEKQAMGVDREPGDQII